jgi:hypothetical protein
MQIAPGFGGRGRESGRGDARHGTEGACRVSISPTYGAASAPNKGDFSVSRKMFCIWFTNHATVTAEASE